MDKLLLLVTTSTTTVLEPLVLQNTKNSFK